MDPSSLFQCLHFPGGLTQTDWFSMFQGGLGLGYGVTAYNQNAYCNDVSWRQNQMYQEKNYHLSWVAIAREDVREMMSISVNRINNYMLVATLIMAVAADALFFVQTFHDDSPGFVLNAFWLSMGISIAFFALSIMFGIKGQNSAFVNTMRLLTWEIRPENPAPYIHDYMGQASKYEKDGLKQLFRVPGVSPSYNHARRSKSESREHSGDRELGSHAAVTHGQGSLRSRKSGSSRGGLDDYEEQQPAALEQLVPRTKELIYLARFAHYMQLWIPYEANAKYCIGLGLITLAQGGAYFSLGMLRWSSEYGAVPAVAMMVIFVYLTIMVYMQNYRAKHYFVTWLVVFLFAWGPTAAAVGTLVQYPPIIRQVCAPLTCLGQCCLYLGVFFVSFVELKPPSTVANQYIEGLHGERFTTWSPGTKHIVDPSMAHETEDKLRQSFRGKSFTRQLSQKVFGKTLAEDENNYNNNNNNSNNNNSLPEVGGEASTPQSERVEEETALLVQRTCIRLVRSTLFLSALLWASLLFVEVLSSSHSMAEDAKNGYSGVVNLQELPIDWPSDATWLHALTCRRGSEFFVANRYQVFRVDPTRRTAKAEPCGDLQWPITDVSSHCNSTSGPCRPLVLLEDALAGGRPGASVVVDCGATAGKMPLLREPVTAQRFSVNAMPSTAAELLALHGGRVVEYGQALPGSPLKGFSPRCERAAVGDDVLSIDTAGDRLFVFRPRAEKDGAPTVSGSVDVRLLLSSEKIGTWQLPPDHDSLVSGCALDAKTVVLLTGGAQPRLWLGQ
ncbi:unnamed protein product, partial [Polarella glacialis]